jgi:hypothetical protein
MLMNYRLLELGSNIRENPGFLFHSLTHGRVMPLKIEKTVKNWEKPLKFVYPSLSLDNIELLPFEHCSFVPLQLRTSEFCGGLWVH